MNPPAETARDIIRDVYTQNFLTPEYMQLLGISVLLRHMGISNSVKRGTMEEFHDDGMHSNTSDPWNIWAISVDDHILGAAGEGEWEDIANTAHREHGFLAGFRLSDEFEFEKDVDETFIFENSFCDEIFKNWLRTQMVEFDRQHIDTHTPQRHAGRATLRL